LSAAESAERRAGYALGLVLHEVVNIIVIADSFDISKRASVEAGNASAADEFFVAVRGKIPVDNEGQAVCGSIATKTGKKVGEVFLVHDADSGVIHLADDKAIVQLLCLTSIDEFLLHVVFGYRFGRCEEEIALGRFGLSKKAGTAVAIGGGGIGAGTTSHEQFLELAILDDGDFLSGDAFFIN